MTRWVLFSMAVVAGLARAEAPWTTISNERGVTLEAQAVAGSGFENLRVTCVSPVSPRAFIKALWGVASDTTPNPQVVRREVLIDEAQVRRYYDVVDAAPASGRDYVMHQAWSEDEATGAVTMRFESVDDPRKPVTPGLVRFGRVAGTVSATPRPQGGSTLSYIVFTDLGGAVPAWLSRGAQREAAKKFLLEIRRRAEKSAH